MSTWAGAIVETRGRADFAVIAAKYRIAVTSAGTPSMRNEAGTRASIAIFFMGSLGCICCAKLSSFAMLVRARERGGRPF
jgi:hypothetical protein